MVGPALALREMLRVVLTLRCDGYAPLRDDKITVNSWHGLVEHQPLGSTNRMRRVVVSATDSGPSGKRLMLISLILPLLQYAESRKLRLKVNGYKDYIEPKSVAEVPAGPVPVAAAA